MQPDETNQGGEGDYLAAFEVRGYNFRDCLPRCWGLRSELQGQPCFTNLNGPMWGGVSAMGEGIIRYESNAACNILSA